MYIDIIVKKKIHNFFFVKNKYIFNILLDII